MNSEVARDPRRAPRVRMRRASATENTAVFQPALSNGVPLYFADGPRARGTLLRRPRARPRK
eukprot:8144387-Pyramimonas_sp.AAC.1